MNIYNWCFPLLIYVVVNVLVQATKTMYAYFMQGDGNLKYRKRRGLLYSITQIRAVCHKLGISVPDYAAYNADLCAHYRRDRTRSALTGYFFVTIIWSILFFVIGLVTSTNLVLFSSVLGAITDRVLSLIERPGIRSSVISEIASSVIFAPIFAARGVTIQAYINDMPFNDVYIVYDSLQCVVDTMHPDTWTSYSRSEHHGSASCSCCGHRGYTKEKASLLVEEFTASARQLSPLNAYYLAQCQRVLFGTISPYDFA